MSAASMAEGLRAFINSCKREGREGQEGCLVATKFDLRLCIMKDKKKKGNFKIL